MAKHPPALSPVPHSAHFVFEKCQASYIRSPIGHSRVSVEAKSPHELQQGLAHGHSHLETRRGTGGQGSLPCPFITLTPKGDFHAGRQGRGSSVPRGYVWCTVELCVGLSPGPRERRMHPRCAVLHVHDLGHPVLHTGRGMDRPHGAQAILGTLEVIPTLHHHECNMEPISQLTVVLTAKYIKAPKVWVSLPRTNWSCPKRSKVTRGLQHRREQMVQPWHLRGLAA